jgi:hypothetical protein
MTWTCCAMAGWVSCSPGSGRRPRSVRASGTLASTFHARARTATIRAQLINVPARLARSARRLLLHLPTD